jgi:hypothetical protein
MSKYPIYFGSNITKSLSLRLESAKTSTKIIIKIGLLTFCNYLLTLAVQYDGLKFKNTRAYLDNTLGDSVMSKYNRAHNHIHTFTHLFGALLSKYISGKIKITQTPNLLGILTLVIFTSNLIFDKFLFEMGILNHLIGYLINNVSFILFYYCFTTDFSQRYTLALDKTDFVMYGFIWLLISQISEPSLMCLIPIVGFKFYISPCIYGIIFLISKFLNQHDKDFKTDAQKSEMGNFVNSKYLTSIILGEVPIVSLGLLSTGLMVGLVCYYNVFHSKEYSALSSGYYQSKLDIDIPSSLSQPGIINFLKGIFTNTNMILSTKFPNFDNTMKGRVQSLTINVITFFLFYLSLNSEQQKSVKFVSYFIAPLAILISHILYYKDLQMLERSFSSINLILRRPFKQIPYICLSYQTKMYIRYLSEFFTEPIFTMLFYQIGNIIKKQYSETPEFYKMFNTIAIPLIVLIAIINFIHIYLIYVNYFKGVQVDFFDIVDKPDKIKPIKQKTKKQTKKKKQIIKSDKVNGSVSDQ